MRSAAATIQLGFDHGAVGVRQGEIDEPALTAGTLHAFDVSLLAVATPRTRARLLDHIAALDSQLPRQVAPLTGRTRTP